MEQPTENRSTPGLKRSLGLAAIAIFGIGDILGAGVYGLVGRIAGLVGHAAWMSYAAAGVAAALTGLTYAEFTSRYPRAGGAAHFCHVAYRTPLVTFLVMFFVVLSGLFSIATTSRIFADYAMAAFPGAPEVLRVYVIPIAFVMILTFVAMRGIVFSSFANGVCTAVEVAGLLAIIAVGLRFVGSADYMTFSAKALEQGAALTVVSGAAIAFFAFIGFEDMANLSEEVKNPERNVPLGICIAIAVTATIYMLIALISVSVLQPEALAATRSPLLDVVRSASPNFPAWIYSIIPAFAVFNTALLNLLMASRLVYGMSRGRANLLPSELAYLHPVWRTPVAGVAVGASIAVALLLSTRDLARLAQGTTTFLLVVFFLLHVGLLIVKRRPGEQPPQFRTPVLLPVLGALTCLGILYRQDPVALKTAAFLTLGALALFGVNYWVLGRREMEVVD
ncbi:MAG: APC family permease [Candidatus Sumerlaeaceae bacterium]|nr:APC family permease [Candidatus Sumerlaeaceae bacterium]